MHALLLSTRKGLFVAEAKGDGVWYAALPSTFAYDLVDRHGLALAPDGTLAFGSTTGNVFASTDRGESWSVVSNHLPPVYAVTFAP